MEQSVGRRALFAVAVAADPQFALEEVARSFQAELGQAVRISFGSSGNITRQVEQGSPVEMLLSADEGFVSRLAEAGLTRDRGELYAVGSPLRTEAGMDVIRKALDAGRISRFAIANPARHAVLRPAAA